MSADQFVALYDMVQAYGLCGLFGLGFLMGVR